METEEKPYFLQIETRKKTLNKVYDTTDVNYASYLMTMALIGGDVCMPEYLPAKFYLTELCKSVRDTLNGNCHANEIYGENTVSRIRTLVKIKTGDITHVHGCDSEDLAHATLAAFDSLYARTRPAQESDFEDMPESLLKAFRYVAMWSKSIFKYDTPIPADALYNGSRTTVGDVAEAAAEYLRCGMPKISIYTRHDDQATFVELDHYARIDKFASKIIKAYDIPEPLLKMDTPERHKVCLAYQGGFSNCDYVKDALATLQNVGFNATFAEIWNTVMKVEFPHKTDYDQRVAPIIRMKHSGDIYSADILIMAALWVDDTLVLKTNITRLLQLMQPSAIYVMAYDIDGNAPEALLAEFPKNIREKIIFAKLAKK